MGKCGFPFESAYKVGQYVRYLETDYWWRPVAYSTSARVTFPASTALYQIKSVRGYYSRITGFPSFYIQLSLYDGVGSEPDLIERENTAESPAYTLLHII